MARIVTKPDDLVVMHFPHKDPENEIHYWQPTTCERYVYIKKYDTLFYLYLPHIGNTIYPLTFVAIGKDLDEVDEGFRNLPEEPYGTLKPYQEWAKKS